MIPDTYMLLARCGLTPVADIEDFGVYEFITSNTVSGRLYLVPGELAPA